MATPERAARMRFRLVRWALLLLAAGAAYSVAVVYHRDTAHRRGALERLLPFERTLQATLDRSGRLPLALPRTTPEGSPLPDSGFTYLSHDAAQVLRAYAGPVVVGRSPTVGCGLRADGCAILVCDGGQCAVEWISLADYAERSKRQQEWVRNRRRELLERGPNLP